MPPADQPTGSTEAPERARDGAGPERDGAGPSRDGTAAEPSGDGSARDVYAALEDVLDADSDAVRRLSYAHTSVSFRVDGDDERATLLLDRNPPELSDSEDAEVEIELDREQAGQFTRGLLHTPAALITGALAGQGPLRKYLEVDPILRGLLRTRAGEKRTPTVSGAKDQEWDENLLAVETRGLHKSFGKHEVLKGVDLAIPEGVIAAVIGPSGTGKSVLLNHVIGLMRPDKGDVFVRGRSLNEMSRSEVLALRLEVGVMFQDGALFSAMNIYDNVAFPLRQHTDLKEDEVEEVVMRRLESVGLQDATDKVPGELSGGMKKRAGLARAMVLDPGIVLCDEPDSGLDPVRTALIGDLLREQHAEVGGTMLVITHDIALTREIAEHISVLWQGEILESGMADQVFNSDSEFVQQFLAGETEGPLGMDA